MTTTWYRIQSSARPVEQLLDPEYQTSTSYCTATERHGVSVCRSIEDLTSYLAQSGMPFDETYVLVEVTGPRSDEDDEDAALGAVLVLPETIESVTDLDDAFFDMVGSAYDVLAA